MLILYCLIEHSNDDEVEAVLTPNSKKAISSGIAGFSSEPIEAGNDSVTLSPRSKAALEAKNQQHMVEIPCPPENQPPAVVAEENKPKPNYAGLGKGSGAKALLAKKLAAAKNNRFDSADYYSKAENEPKKDNGSEAPKEEPSDNSEPKAEEHVEEPKAKPKYAGMGTGSGAKALLAKKMAAAKNNRFDSADYYANNKQ